MASRRRSRRRYRVRTTRSTHAREHEAEVLRPGRSRRDLPARRHVEVLRPARRNRRSWSSSTPRIICSTARRQEVGEAIEDLLGDFESDVRPCRDAVIVSAVRTASRQGAERARCAYTRPDEMAATVDRRGARAARPALDPAEVDDVILGCAMPEAEQGLNVARIASLRAGVPVTASAVTVNRFCSSGPAGDRLRRRADHGRVRRRRRRRRHRVDEPGADGRAQGRAQPGAGRQLSRRVPHAPASWPRTTRASRAISREEQDAFALRSHQRAVAAIDAGRFDDEIVPLTSASSTAAGGRRRSFDADEGPRRDTSLEALGQAEAGVSRRPARSPPATRRRRATAPRPSS